MIEFEKHTEDYSFKPQFGDMFYSDFFHRPGIVVRYNNDTDWWFLIEGKMAPLRAQCKPSDLKWLKMTEVSMYVHAFRADTE